MAINIPIVSFAPFLEGDEEGRRSVAEEVYNAFSTVGFVYLKDHGIPQSHIDGIFVQSKGFFQLPLEQKLQWKLREAHINQGYTADGAEGEGDHKECYEHRRFANGLCPDDDELSGFRQTMDAFYSECLTLSLAVLKCLAMVLQLGDTFFDHITTHADPQLRLIHYPEIERVVIDREGHARIMPHSDFGLCTLLFQDSIGGLEIDPFHTGEFKPATPVPGTVLVNIGDLMQRYTNDRVKSTLHRVMAPRTDMSTSIDRLPARYSIPFFVHPNPETLIDPITLSPDEEKHYAPVHAAEWRNMHTARNYKLELNSVASEEVATIG